MVGCWDQFGVQIFELLLPFKMIANKGFILLYDLGQTVHTESVIMDIPHIVHYDPLNGKRRFQNLIVDLSIDLGL